MHPLLLVSGIRQTSRLVVMLFLLAIMLSGPIAVKAYSPVLPLKKSANGRYLVDQMNVPFLITGDSPQALMVNVSTTEADMFFADRQSHGFNAVWINLLCDEYTAGRPDGSTYDGILPFTEYLAGHSGDPLYYDLTTPNPAYFARCDAMINLAANYNLVIFLDPIETGGWLPENGGGNGVMPHNGSVACRAYGQFLGARYRDVPNIIWMSGNDYQAWNDGISDTFVTAVALGIKDNDSNHLHTVELNFPTSGSLDDPNWAPIISLNASYTYFPTYAQVLKDYSRPDYQPVFLVEANYEFEHYQGTQDTTPLNLRKQEYWSLLSGACGQLYGNRYTWTFTGDWQSHLDTPGAIQMAHVRALLDARAWYRLVPDEAHAFVTAGYGTFFSVGLVEDSSYLTAARVPDGSLAIAYMPTIRSITVDMTQLSGPVTAQWYDPSADVYVAIDGSPFPNAGRLVFSPPGNNGDGDGDWVLVLEAPPMSGDLTHDGRVDANDLAAFQACFTGPGVAYRQGGLPLGCVLVPDGNGVIAADFDGDGDVDDDDFGILQRLYSEVVQFAGDFTHDGRVDLADYAVFQACMTGPGVSYIQTARPPACTLVPDGDGKIAADFDGDGDVDLDDFGVFQRSYGAGTQIVDPIPPGLVAGWSFNEGTGTTASDASAYGNTGTLVGGATWAAGKYGTCLSLDGTSGFLSVPNSRSLDISRSSLTLSMWLNPQTPISGTDLVVLGKFWNFDMTAPYYQYGLELTGGNQPSFYIGTQNGYLAVSMGSTLPYGQWSHLAVVFNGVWARFYLNGGLVATQPLQASMTARGGALHVGSDATPAQFYRGMLDEIRIYNRTLSDSEIAMDAATPVGSP